MKFSEIISERSLSDVGVRGGKFYLSASGRNLDIPHFLATGELPGIKGISSTKYIWADFGPNMGRDIFFVMNANDALRENNLKRVGYTDPDALIANNSAILGRILSIRDVARGPSDNLISGVFQKAIGKTSGIYTSNGGDPISVSNRAQFIAHTLQKGRDFEGQGRGSDEMFKDVDTSKFGDWKNNGLRLSSYDDYANLYFQAAKAAGWYGKEFVKMFAPQNRSKWLPMLKRAIVAQANIYADESEWVNESDTFKVPTSTLVILAVPQKYLDGKPEMKPEDGPLALMGRWSNYDDDLLVYYTNLVDAFKKSPYKVKIVEAGRSANQLVRTQAKRRGS